MTLLAATAGKTETGALGQLVGGGQLRFASRWPAQLARAFDNVGVESTIRRR
jgi:hypothetical protein